MHIHTRHMLKSKDIRLLKENLSEQFGQENIENLIPKKAKVEILKLDAHEELIVIDNILGFWKREDEYIPLLSLLLTPNLNFNIKFVEVDKGAIPHVTNGADVMRPGIVFIDPEIKKNDVVKILDTTHKRALAVGRALYDAEEMENLKTGKVIKNIHTINDELWKFSKSFRS
ncbi:MAG: DUF1947 domain-containing protein [Promethearchaeota archaeon]